MPGAFTPFNCNCMFFRLTALSIQEMGQRSNQEDSLFPPYAQDAQEGSLYILCDGMGGHAAGEVASQTVCEAMSRYVAGHARADGYFGQADFDAALDAAYDALDAKDTDDEKKMGTTLTFVKFHAGGCFTAHIGDSRIYHIRPSEHRILHMTRDHSLVNDLVKLGELTPEEAKTSRQKNIITRAVQPHQERRVKADCLNITDLRAGDYFYLCSDGMLEQSEDEEILNILSLPRPDADKVGILRGATKDNRDNHSAYLVRIVAVSDRPIEEDPDFPAEPEPAPAPAPAPKRGKAGLWILILLALAAAAVAAIPESREYVKGLFAPKKVEAPVQHPVPGQDADSLAVERSDSLSQI